MALEWHRRGMLQKDIAQRLGTTKDRVRILLEIAKAPRRQQLCEPWMRGLDIRLASALLDHGFTTFEQVQTALAEGNLRFEEANRIGKQSIEELRRWVGTASPAAR